MHSFGLILVLHLRNGRQIGTYYEANLVGGPAFDVKSRVRGIVLALAVKRQLNRGILPMRSHGHPLRSRKKLIRVAGLAAPRDQDVAERKTGLVVERDGAFRPRTPNEEEAGGYGGSNQPHTR